tara:strand:+ start:10359 stop:10820 length:462 start_codon:yes stop_codon:yes gene_type:complete
MFFSKKYHIFFKIFVVSLFLLSCQLKEPTKNHGILFLKNRSDTLIINKSNKNDILNKIGHPHSKSISNENEWIYIERVLTKGDYLKLGQNVLKTNNILILNFNKYGILTKKTFLDKNSKEKIIFSEKITENNLTQKSFVQKLLQSIRSKMYKK